MHSHINIDDALLAKLQHLAMIELTQAEAQEVRKNLNEILHFVENLSSIDTSNITLHTSAQTPLRPDTPISSHIAKSVLDTAPKAEHGFFLVPKIIE